MNYLRKREIRRILKDNLFSYLSNMSYVECLEFIASLNSLEYIEVRDILFHYAVQTLCKKEEK